MGNVGSDYEEDAPRARPSKSSGHSGQVRRPEKVTPRPSSQPSWLIENEQKVAGSRQQSQNYQSHPHHPPPRMMGSPMHQMPNGGGGGGGYYPQQQQRPGMHPNVLPQIHARPPPNVNPYYQQNPHYAQQMPPGPNPYYQQPMPQQHQHQQMAQSQRQPSGLGHGMVPREVPPFPNRIQKPSDEMVQQFQQTRQNGLGPGSAPGSAPGMGPMMVPQPSANNQIMPYPMSSGLIYDDRTLDSLMERPLTDIKFEKSNFSDRIKEYEEGYEKEETEFKKQEESRRTKFNRYMDRKKEKLREEIKRFEESYNPYEILGLENGDLDMGNIRRAYKKMALKYHPDKVGDKYGDHFQVITQSYIYLLNKAEKIEKSSDRAKRTMVIEEDYEEPSPSISANPQYSLSNKIAERERDMLALRPDPDPEPAQIKRPRGRPRKEPQKVVDHGGKAGVPRDTPLNRFMELKKSREMEGGGGGVGGRSGRGGRSDEVDVMDVNQNNFDINKFNTLFEKYKFDDDETNRGYGDLLKNGMGDGDEDDGAAKKIFSQSMSKDIFNAHFDEMKKGRSSGKRDAPIIPDAIDSSSRTSCAQIGGAGNFSGSNYTDIKQAFYEDNMLIDPSTVKIKQYKNLQELENERSSVSNQPDPETIRRYQQYNQREKEMEDDRLRMVRDRDDALRSHNSRVSRKFMVNGKKVE